MAVAMKLFVWIIVLICLCFTYDFCEGSIYATPIKLIGGKGGRYTRKTYTDGRTLNKIEAWAGKWQLRGVRFHWSNGHEETIGKTKGRHSSFTFQTGERLKSLSLWRNGKKKNKVRCGAFKMITDKNREYFPKMTKKRLKKKYRTHVNVGSGIIVGFKARHGSDVDALGFYLLRPIKHAILKNVNYPQLHLNRVGLRPWNIDIVDYSNYGSTTQPQKLSGARTVTTSSEWSISSSLEYSISVSVQAGVPAVASVGVKTTFKVGITATYNRKTVHSDTRTYNFQVKVPPRKRTYAVARIYHGPLNTKYTGTMYVTLDNGQYFRYNVQGYYKGVTSTGAYVDLKENAV